MTRDRFVNRLIVIGYVIGAVGMVLAVYRLVTVAT